jgi:CheY-like chemotaxis protein
MARLKILVAEDNKSVQALYNLGLNDELYEKKFVADGKQAIDTYESWNPDMVVLDIMMPVMTGFNALKEIRDREKTNGRKTAVIMSTGLSDKSDIMDCAKLGIQGYIIKPFKHRELAEMLEGYYRKHNGK